MDVQGKFDSSSESSAVQAVRVPFRLFRLGGIACLGRRYYHLAAGTDLLFHRTGCCGPMRHNWRVEASTTSSCHAPLGRTEARNW